MVAEAVDGHEAVELVRSHRPDIAMLDIRMPRLDGLSAAAELRTAMPEVAIIMLTTFDEDEYVSRALADGAAGFLLKAADPRELIIGVRAVADGAAYLSPRIAQKVITRLSGGRLSRADTARRRVETLTPREREVLALVGLGHVQPGHRPRALPLRGHRQVPRQRDPAAARLEQPRPGRDPRLRGRPGARRFLTRSFSAYAGTAVQRQMYCSTPPGWPSVPRERGSSSPGAS